MEGVRYRAVLLDVLGTLLELQPPWPLLRAILKRRHGIDVAEKEAREAILAEMAYYRSHHQEGRDAATLAELRRRCALVVREHLPATAQLSLDELTDVLLDAIRFAPFPDAAPTLAELREAGFRLAAVSNWDCSLRSVLAEVGLAGALDAVIVSAEAGAAKPDPAIYRAALGKIRCGTEEALFVGDSLETDVAGAEAAGVRALLLDRAAAEGADGGVGSGLGSGLGSGVDVERIFSLSDLLELLGRRPGRLGLAG
jgi:2-haloalkanoic acid dehalogenase type II